MTLSTRPSYVQPEFAGQAPRADIAPAGFVLRTVPSADEAVTDLYRAHAGSLIRLAVVMVGDRATAEDVVQEAFFGLYRRWPYLSDQAKALRYARSAVLNNCRTVHRGRALRTGRPVAEPTSASAEAIALIGEEHRAVLAALNQLPPRQKEALTLRFFADLNDREIAHAMGISRGTVKSTISRGLAALGQHLGEDQ